MILILPKRILAYFADSYLYTAADFVVLVVLIILIINCIVICNNNYNKNNSVFYLMDICFLY